MAIVENTQFGRVGAFRFWCQKVLPAVYDDSLSYYELLCKVTKWLQDLTDVTNTQSDAIEELQDTLAQFMEGEFDSYIEQKVDEWFLENQPDIVAAIASLTESMENLETYVYPRVGSITKSEILPIVTDGWQTFESGYHTTAGGNTKPWLLSGMTLRNANEIFFVERYSNSDNSAIYKADREANTITQIQSSIKTGHANDMSYCPTNNKFYIIPGMSDIDNEDPDYKNVVFEYNSTFTEMNEYAAPESWGAMSWDYVNSKLVFATFIGGNVYDFDVATHTFTQRDVVLDPNPSSFGFIGQGGAVYDDMAYFAFGWNGLSNDNLIGVWDLKTGKLAKTYILPEYSDIMPTGEIEDISFDPNGIMYFASSSPYDNYPDTCNMSVFMRSGIQSSIPFGSMHSSVYPQSVRVEPLVTDYRPPVTSWEFTFKTITEALAYAKGHKIKSIKLYPSKTDSSFYFFKEFVILDGLGDITFECANDYIAILGGIYARGGTTLRWDGNLFIGMLYDMSLNNKIGLYLKDSTFIGSSLTIVAGYDSTIKYGVAMDGASFYFGTSEPYLASGVTGTAMNDNSTGGHRYTTLGE